MNDLTSIKSDTSHSPLLDDGSIARVARHRRQSERLTAVNRPSRISPNRDHGLDRVLTLSSPELLTLYPEQLTWSAPASVDPREASSSPFVILDEEIIRVDEVTRSPKRAAIVDQVRDASALCGVPVSLRWTRVRRYTEPGKPHTVLTAGLTDPDGSELKALLELNSDGGSVVLRTQFGVEQNSRSLQNAGQFNFHPHPFETPRWIVFFVSLGLFTMFLGIGLTLPLIALCGVSMILISYAAHGSRMVAWEQSESLRQRQWSEQHTPFLPDVSLDDTLLGSPSSQLGRLRCVMEQAAASLVKEMTASGAHIVDNYSRDRLVTAGPLKHYCR